MLDSSPCNFRLVTSFAELYYGHLGGSSNKDSKRIQTKKKERKDFPVNIRSSTEIEMKYNWTYLDSFSFIYSRRFEFDTFVIGSRLDPGLLFVVVVVGEGAGIGGKREILHPVNGLEVGFTESFFIKMIF